MGPVKIGFLSPYSGVYPYYAQHIMAGMLMGIYPNPTRQNKLQFIPAYTQMGTAAAVKDAVNKLLFFDQVDVISGLISYKSMPDIIPTIEKFNKLGLLFDMGECIPYFEHLSPNVFYVSQQIWQSQYALGYWAQKQFGGTGMMVMPVYEAGYHLSNTFYRGVIDAGAGQLGLHVIAHEASEKGRLNLEGLFEELKKNPPSFVHAIFAGDAGNEFLQAWQQSPYHTIPLTVVENMVYDDILQDIAGLDLTLYAATTWSRTDEHLRNQKFVKQYETTGGQMANIFGLLGYEAGLALKEVMPQLERRNMEAVKSALQQELITGPRGERNFYPSSGFALPEIDIIKVKTSLKNIYKTIISQGKGLKFDSGEFQEIHEESISGWQNPYLCI